MIQSLYLLTLTLLLLMSFMFLSHPLSMGFLLLIQTILISMITGMMSPTSDSFMFYLSL